MRTPRVPSRSWRSLHQTASTSDVPVVTRRHTRVSYPITARCAVVIILLADGDAGFDLRARGPCFAPPVKVGRAKARERLLSYREPASRNPQTVHRKLFKTPCTRAPFRLLPIRAPRQAVLRTSSWLAPSRFTNRPCDLPVEKTRDASDRYLPPKRTACTRTSRVPDSSRNFRCGDTPRRLRLRAVVSGDRTFHDVRGPLRRIVIGTSPISRAYAFEYERGRFVPTVPVAIEPLTPLSRNPVHPRASHTFACAALVTTVPPFGGFTAGRRMQGPAKTTLNARP